MVTPLRVKQVLPYVCARVCMRMYVCICVCIYLCVCGSYTLSCVCGTHRYTYTHAHIHTRARARTYTHAHTRTHTHSYMLQAAIAIVEQTDILFPGEVGVSQFWQHYLALALATNRRMHTCAPNLLLICFRLDDYLFDSFLYIMVVGCTFGERSVLTNAIVIAYLNIYIYNICFYWY